MRVSSQASPAKILESIRSRAVRAGCEIRDNLGLIPFFSFYFFTLLISLHPLVRLRFYAHESVHKALRFPGMNV
jgi:hypothetical protein